MLSAAAAVFTASTAEVYFEDDFSGDWAKVWKPSNTPGKEMGKWDVTPGKWFVDEEANKGLAVTEDMRFHSITAPLTKTASSKGKDLVLQFSAKIENHQYAFCGGGYIKLLPEDTKVETFGGDDEYAIMFGPDLCGCVARPRSPLRHRARPAPIPAFLCHQACLSPVLPHAPQLRREPHPRHLQPQGPEPSQD